MRYAICFITCHHVSPQDGKQRKRKEKKRRGESVKTPQKWSTTASGKGIKRERWERKSAKQTEKWKNERQKERKPVLCRVGSELLLSPLPCISH